MDSKQKWTDIVTKAWADEQFKQRLLADPASELKEYDVGVPAGMTVKIVENTDKVHYLTLPCQSSEVDLSDEQLEKVAGGVNLAIIDRFKAIVK